MKSDITRIDAMQTRVLLVAPVCRDAADKSVRFRAAGKGHRPWSPPIT
jgi:hypothetical protein